jgi:hypothetical protein
MTFYDPGLKPGAIDEGTLPDPGKSFQNHSLKPGASDESTFLWVNQKKGKK